MDFHPRPDPDRKTDILLLPNISVKNIVFSRTTLKGDYPFINAVLLCKNRTFYDLELSEKNKMAEKVHLNICTSIVRTYWNTEPPCEAELFLIEKTVTKNLTQLYKYLNKGKTPKSTIATEIVETVFTSVNLDVYRLLTQIFPLTKLNKKIRSILKNSDFTFEKIWDKILLDLTDYSEKSIKKFRLKDRKKDQVFKSSFMALFKTMFSLVETWLFNRCVRENSISFSEEYVTEFSRLFRKNYIFIDEKSGNPFLMCDKTDINENWPFYIILYTKSFEAIGKVISATDIRREFSIKEKVVQELLEMAMRKEEIEDYEPEKNESNNCSYDF